MSSLSHLNRLPLHVGLCGESDLDRIDTGRRSEHILVEFRDASNHWNNELNKSELHKEGRGLTIHQARYQESRTTIAPYNPLHYHSALSSFYHQL